MGQNLLTMKIYDRHNAPQSIKEDYAHYSKAYDARLRELKMLGLGEEHLPKRSLGEYVSHVNALQMEGRKLEGWMLEEDFAPFGLSIKKAENFQKVLKDHGFGYFSIEELRKPETYKYNEQVKRFFDEVAATQKSLEEQGYSKKEIKRLIGIMFFNSPE